MGGYVREDHGIGANYRAVTDVHVAEDLGSSSDADAIPDNRDFLLVRSSTDDDAWGYDHVATNAGARVDDDAEAPVDEVGVLSYHHARRNNGVEEDKDDSLKKTRH